MAFAYIDECKSKKFSIVAVIVESRFRLDLEARCRNLVLKGQRRIHFKHESDSRRKLFFATLKNQPFRVLIVSSWNPRLNMARAECLELLALSPHFSNVTNVILERDATVVQIDAKILAKFGLKFEHLEPHENACLWISDAYAWINQRGGHWKSNLRDPRVTFLEVD